MLVPKLTLLYRSGLCRYFVCTESDCTDIDIQCTETGCTEKTCIESVCTEIVLYRKRPTPRPQSEVIHETLQTWCQEVLLLPESRQQLEFLATTRYRGTICQLLQAAAGWLPPRYRPFLKLTLLWSIVYKYKLTQRASMDAGVKHLSVHICLITSVYQILQSTWFAYWSVADSSQVGRKIIYITSWCIQNLSKHALRIWIQ